MTKFKFTILCLICACQIFAQDTISSIHPAEQPDLTALADKVIYIEQINSKILDLLYFTVATIVAVFIGFGLLNYFSSLKLNNSKLQDLEKSYKLRVAELEKSLNEKYTDESQRLEANSKARSKEMQKESNKTIEDNINNVQIKIGYEISRLKTRVSANRISLLEKHLSEETDTYSDKYNELSTLIEILSLEIEMHENYQSDYFVNFDSRLGDIATCVKNRAMTLRDKERLMKVLSQLPERVQSAKEIIRACLGI